MVYTMIKEVPAGNTDVVIDMEEVRGLVPNALLIKNIIASGAGATAELMLSDGQKNISLDVSTGAGDPVAAKDIYLASRGLESVYSGVDRVLVKATTNPVSVYISFTDKIH